MTHPTPDPTTDYFAAEEAVAHYSEHKGGVILCFTRCEACMQNYCYEPPVAHPWAGADDLEHARETGLPEPTGICACPCAQEAQA